MCWRSCAIQPRRPRSLQVTDLRFARGAGPFVEAGCGRLLVPPWRRADLVCRTCRWLELGARLAGEQRTEGELGLQGVIGQSRLSSASWTSSSALPASMPAC